MSTKDVNYPPLEFHDYHGTPFEWIEVRVDATWPGSWVISGHPNPAFNGEFPVPDATHSDTIKVSACSYMRVVVKGNLRGGTEDCLDVNNKSNHIEVIADYLSSGGKFIATIKGESSFVWLVGTILVNGTEVDIDLGNWSDQAKGKTTNVVLRVEDPTGLTIRVINATMPAIFSGSQFRWLFPNPRAWYHDLCVWCFMTYHKLFQ